MIAPGAPRTPKKILAGLAVVVAALAACSHGPTRNAAPTTTSTPAPSTTALNVGVISPPLPKLPTVAKAHGAIKALTLGKCATGPGVQHVSGKITSPAATKVSFLVSVAWTTNASDVLGLGYAVVANVAPGTTKTFEITAKVVAGATRCVPNVTYGAIRS